MIVCAVPATTNVNACIIEPLGFVAVIVTGKEPVTGAVPERTPVVVLSVTVPGNAGLTVYVGAGEPLAMTLNGPPATPALKVVVFALEKLVGAAARTIVKFAETGVVTVGRPAPQVPSASTSTDEPEVLMTYELALAKPVGCKVNVASS